MNFYNSEDELFFPSSPQVNQYACFLNGSQEEEFTHSKLLQDEKPFYLNVTAENSQNMTTLESLQGLSFDQVENNDPFNFVSSNVYEGDVEMQDHQFEQQSFYDKEMQSVENNSVAENDDSDRFSESSGLHFDEDLQSQIEISDRDTYE